MSSIIDIPEIDPEPFLYELYDASGLQYLEGWELAKFAVGYCDAGRLSVRPRSGLLALMCELPDGDKVWFHINPRMLDSLNERRKRLLSQRTTSNKLSETSTSDF